MASLEWINHAGFAVRHGALKLVIDPWLEGSVFNNSWSLLSPSPDSSSIFNDATHIWFSHEHPDHFSPPTLKKIPVERRHSIVVLFRATADRRVVTFCEKLGFKCVVLEPGVSFHLGPEFKVRCGVVDSDSWLWMDAGGLRCLNLNDCVISTPSELGKVSGVVGSIDVLLTQFSYAVWCGNREDVESRQRAAKEKLDAMVAQAAAMKARFVVPCASFVRFSHDESSYMNDAANSVRTAHERLLKSGHVSVVLYPGDVWSPPNAVDSLRAIARYEHDSESADQRGGSPARTVALPVLLESSRGFVERMSKRNAIWMLRPLVWLSYLRPVRVRVFDLGVTLAVDTFSTATQVDGVAADVEMSAEALKFCFDFDFGFDTTLIGGRFQEAATGGVRRLSHQFALARRNNDGFYLPSLLWRSTYALQKILPARAR